MSARAVAPALGTLAQWLSYLEQLHPQLIELGLERVSEVARRLGVARPAARVITVAGTNGKGSTVRFLELLLSAAGQRVGCYTSPHLLHYRERIRIAGEEASDPAICAAFAQIEQARGDISLTYFEFGTLAALLLFAQQPLDILLLEVGLGGRLDAVNLVDADLAIITTIDYDHQEWLGHDLDSIAAEKAGILRAGRPAILGMNPPPPRLLQLAQSLAQPLLRRGVDFDARVAGDQWHYQESAATAPLEIGPLLLPRLPLDSALCALRAVRLLGHDLPVPRIAELMATATLAGRFQQLAGRVPIILDVAHNPQSAVLLASRLAAEPCAGRTHAVVAIMADKAIELMLQHLLPRVERWYPAEARTPRSATSGQLVELLRGLGVAVDQRFASVAAAIGAAEAVAQPGDRILIFGSFYTVAEALEGWQARQDGEGPVVAAEQMV